jgi:hypothetical protein
MGIAGRQWYLPINGTSTRPHRESSNAAGKPTGQVETIGTGELGHWQLLSRRIWLRSNGLYLAMVNVPLDLAAFINAPAPHGGLHFVSFRSVRIIGEQSREENLWSWL